MTGLRTTHIPKRVADQYFPRKDSEVTDVSHVVVDSTVPPPPPPETDEAQALQPDLIKARPDDPFKIPQLNEAYIAADDLRAVADDLREQEGPEIEHLNWNLQGARIRYRWAQKGGTSRGEPVYARCVKLAGLGRFNGRADFNIVFSVDHLTDLGPTYQQIRAELFHQLSKIEKVVSDDGEISYRVRSPDIVAFRSELTLFGLWKAQLRDAAEAFQQVGLFDAEAD